MTNKQLVKLLDTGQRNEYFALRISMPTKDYKPRPEKETKSIKRVLKNA